MVESKEATTLDELGAAGKYTFNNDILSYPINVGMVEHALLDISTPAGRR